MGLLPSFVSVMVHNLAYGRTGGMVWGWVVFMIPIQCIACSLAELCSAIPTSGGLYYAAAFLAPVGYGPLASWITGWSHWIAQVTGPPSGDYALASMIFAVLLPTKTSARKVNRLVGPEIVKPRSSGEVWGTIHNGTDYSDGIAVFNVFHRSELDYVRL
ncbi:hypothetical protein CROQUDRAFT_98025 [Cronartium quercuum f. sp. fusiforme G11]|uniref:Uncharacterized protein n=1 Tax=Cronartium quercuum f. sp. fusiforme G11 TaxID=708437 RepID=A0A9P6T7H0_9BASI|nr:hypothetical protein CROQUDRAFT_98025 [Cronartium quercuum f. sp. fusiforme G11]